MKKVFLRIFHSILYKYIEFESKYYREETNKFNEGDSVTPNWKAEVYFDEQLPRIMKIKKISKTNTIYTECGEIWSPYWLTNP